MTKEEILTVLKERDELNDFMNACIELKELQPERWNNIKSLLYRSLKHGTMSEDARKHFEHIRNIESEYKDNIKDDE